MKLVLVGIGGPSSSGKTTVAKALHSLFEKSTLIHLDDFYFPDAQIPYNEEAQIQNWDCEGAINWVKFKSYIAEVRKTNGEILPMETLEIDSELKLSEGEVAKLEAQVATTFGQNYHFVFVDGFMLYHNEEILKLFDVKLFFHAPYEILKARREARQGYNTVAGFWTDPPSYFDNIVWPEFAKSHKHLFLDEDVGKSLNQESLDLGLADIANDGLKLLMELIQWAIEETQRQVKKMET